MVYFRPILMCLMCGFQKLSLRMCVVFRAEPESRRCGSRETEVEKGKHFRRKQISFTSSWLCARHATDCAKEINKQPLVLL
jgi:hypothetical protein